MLHILYVLSDWSHADQQWCKESSDAFINEFLLKHKAENWDTINQKKSVDQLWPLFWVTQQELEYFLYSSGNLEPQSQSKLLTLLERAGNSYKLNRALKIINELINIYVCKLLKHLKKKIQYTKTNVCIGLPSITGRKSDRR